MTTTLLRRYVLPSSTADAVLMLKSALRHTSAGPTPHDDDVTPKLFAARRPWLARALALGGAPAWRALASVLCSPSSAAAMDARVRWMDDVVWTALKSAVAASDSGVAFLALAAGGDARAARVLAAFASITAVDVDLPASIDAKRSLLTAAGVTPAPALVGIDLVETDALDAALTEAGVPAGTRTVYTAEGLLMYLPAPAGHRLLRALAERAGPGSVIAFDFLPRAFVDGTANDAEFARMATLVAQAGEHMLWGMPTDAADHAAVADTLGWRVIEMLGPDAIARRVFGGGVVLSPHTWFAVWQKK